jgi:hypothetical protein
MAKARIGEQIPSFDDEGITAYMHDVRFRIAWNEVTAVFAYKKDCFAVDQIRVVIAGKWGNVEFTEDDPDFDALRALLYAKLGISPDRYQDQVVSPPFETNWTNLFQRR